MQQKEFLDKIAGIYKKYSSSVNDFLNTASGGNHKIKETKQYYYKPFNVAGNKEIRFWKKSKRVSVTKTTTKK
jgi:hypothetical protein